MEESRLSRITDSAPRATAGASPTANPGVRFAILGPLEIWSGGDQVAIGGRRQLALLGCLLINANRAVSPDQLAEAVWGEHGAGATVKTVQVAVARLRRSLARDESPAATSILRTVPSGYLLRLADGQLDVDVAEERIAAGREALGRGDAGRAADLLRDALALWRGPVLAELRDEEFAQPEIRRLEELRLQAAEERVAAELALGRHAALVPELEALVVAHPARERLAEHLMLALYRSGRHVAALDAYHRTSDHLNRELGLEPSPRLRRLQQDVLEHSAALQWPGDADADGRISPPRASRARLTPPQPVGLRAVAGVRRAAGGAFVGRQADLEELRAHWARARAGQTGLALLRGEPGVGKTRLATHFGDEVAGDGGVVLYGRAEEDALRPFEPLGEALDQLLDHAGPEFVDEFAQALDTLGLLFSETPPAEGPAARLDERVRRFHVFQALVRVLAGASERWPLLVILDDLHWADKPTLLLIRHVLRQAPAQSLLFLGAFRDVSLPAHRSLEEELPHRDRLVRWLADMGLERRLDVIGLAGFDVDETQALVEDRLDKRVTQALVRDLHDRTGGNAFFIEETVRALERSRDPTPDAGRLERLAVPETIRDAVLQRSRQLSALGAQLLAASSVIGRSVDLETVGRLLGVPSVELVAAAEEAQRAGLLAEVPGRGDRVAFTHDVVRDVIYGSLGAPRRLLLHADVGRTLEQLAQEQPVNPAELALHFTRASELAGDPPSPRYAEPARRYKLEAARQASAVYAYEEAGRHLADALRLTDRDDDSTRCDLLLALGRARSRAAPSGEERATARDAFLEAFACAERLGDADRLARAALGVGERYFERTYSDSDHLELLEKALARLEPSGSERMRAMLQARLAENLGFPHEDERAHSLAHEALASARELGDEGLLFAVLLVRHVLLLDIGHVDERMRVDAELTALPSPRRELDAEHHFLRMYDLLEVGDIDAARAEHDRLEKLAGSLGQPLYRSIAAGARGLFAELDGELDLAERHADEFLRYAERAGSLDAMSAWTGQVFGRSLRQRQPGRLASVVEQLASAGGEKLGWRSGLGVLRFEAGDREGARAIYRAEMGGDPGRLPRGMFRLTHLAILSELAARLEDSAGARSLYAELLPHRERNVVVAYCSFWGPVEGVLGALADTFGDVASARAHLETALSRTRAMRASLLSEALEQRLARLTERG